VSFYVPDSWILPFLIALFFTLFVLPIAVLATLGMVFEKKSGSEILRVLAFIIGGFAALCAVALGIDHLESYLGLPSWIGTILTVKVILIPVLMRKKIGEFLIDIGKALKGNTAG